MSNKTRRPDLSSCSKMERLMGAWEEIRAAVVDIQIREGNVLNKIVEELQGMFPDAGIIELGVWDCPNSPTGMCFYDVSEDPIRDFCLVCGHPEERK
jgi:hypothetical protein